MAEFKVGDKVRIKGGAHGTRGFSWGTPDGFQRIMEDAGVEFGDTVKISDEKDYYDEIGLSREDDDSTFIYVFPQFLEHVEEEAPKALEPIVVGGEYWNPGIEAWYTVTNIDWDAEKVYFVFGKQYTGTVRLFSQIKDSFPGFCAPVRAEEAPVEAEPETISIPALEEAAMYMKVEDFLQDLLKLAKRLA